MRNLGRTLASALSGRRLAATTLPSERQDMTQSVVPAWRGEERVRRALARYEPQTRETPVGPNIHRLTSVCRERRSVETLDNSLRQRENRATPWSPKDVIG
jgi:hypothetical protein